MTERTQLVIQRLRYLKDLYCLTEGLCNARSQPAILAMEARIERLERLIQNTERRIDELDRAAAGGPGRGGQVAEGG